MRDRPLILAVDDTPENLEILRMRLEAQAYEVATAVDGEEALARVRALAPDLVLLDVMMPKLDGIEVVRRLKADPTLPFVPVILVTARADARDVIEGLDAGAEDYLPKPFDHGALLARVRSMLRMKRLHDTVTSQSRRLEEQAARLSDLNRTLEQRVDAQVRDLERMGRLRRFVPPQVADLLIAAPDGGRSVLESHRQDVTVMFCDLRGFTAFAETAEPEEVLAVLREYHAALGELIYAYEGTLERFVGDGLLVVFNDPLPQPDHVRRALRLASAMCERAARLAEGWAQLGHQLGFGVGIARGFATLGSVGFDRRIDYSVIGSVPNLASRLCDEAKSGQILVSQRVMATAGESASFRPLAELTLKGFGRPVPAFEVIAVADTTAPAEARAPALHD